MRRWDNLLDSYLRECEARGLSTATVLGKRLELEKWGQWCKRRRPRIRIEEIGPDQILRYIKARTAFHSKATLYSIISHLRNMGDFLVAQGLWNQNPLRWIRGPKLDHRSRLPRRIGQEDLRRIWLEAGQLKNPFQRHLWVTVLSLLYGTGIRRGELERLNLSAWDRSSGLLTVDGRKTGQERRVPVPEAVWSCLESYLPLRHNQLVQFQTPHETALFVGLGGRRLSGQRVGSMIHKLAKKAGVQIVSVHQFRHSCASDLIAGGIGLAQVQKILGHACIQSTCRYVQVSAPERMQAISSHPINKMLQANVSKEALCA